MACFYTIKLPNGGEIKLPANIGKMPDTEAFNNSLRKYWDGVSKLENPKKKEIKETLSTEIKDVINEVRVYLSPDVIKYTTLEKLITDSIPGEDLLTKINEKIPSDIEPQTVGEAMFEALKQKSVSEVKKILGDLSGTIGLGYFNNIEVLNIIGRTSYYAELKRISDEELRDINNGIDPITKTSARMFISEVFSSEKQIAETLLPITSLGVENNTLIIPETEVSPEFVVFEKDNELSLFLAAFKSNILKLDSLAKDSIKTAILPLLSRINAKAKETVFALDNFDLNKFMIGEFDLNGNFIEGDFHKLFKYTSGVEVINAIIDLAVDGMDKPLSVSSNLKKQAKLLFSYLDPRIYGRSMFSDVNDATQWYNEERKKNVEIKNNIISRKYGKFSSKEERDFHYTTTQQARGTVEDVENILSERIDLGRDLVKLPIGRVGLWVIATKITPTSRGIYVNGVVERDGIMEAKGYEFILPKEGNLVVQYKKFVTEEPPEAYNEIIKIPIDGIDISATEGLDPELVKQYAVRGSRVSILKKDGKTFDALIDAVYPGKILLNKIDKKAGRQYEVGNLSTIVRLSTPSVNLEELNKDEEDLKDLFTVVNNAGELASKGDYVVFTDGNNKVINKVAFTDKGNVYVLVPKNDGTLFVKQIPRNKIEKTKYKSEFIDSGLLSGVKDIFSLVENQNSIRKFGYSYFENFERAKNGDFALVKEGDKDTVYVVSDKQNNKFVTRNRSTMVTEYKIIDPEQISGFITDRDISSDFAYDIARVNSSKIVISDNQDIKYYIPENMNFSDFMLFGYNHLNGGIVQESTYPAPENYKDVTKEVLKEISKREGKTIKGLSFVKSDNNIWEKTMPELFQVYNFQALSNEALTSAIQPGAYVKLKVSDSNSIGKHIMRVEKVAGETVTVEYNVFSTTGKLLTISRNIPIKDIKENLTNLFLLKGNSKIPGIINEIGNTTLTAPEELSLTREQALQQLANNLSNAFAGLEVEITPGTGFNNNQYAKIQNGKIIINNNTAKESDVLHEFLHVFMIGLKYNDYNKYEDFLLTYKNERLQQLKNLKELSGSDYDISSILTGSRTLEGIEEAFVKDMSLVMASKRDVNINSLDKFTTVLISSLNAFGIETDAYFSGLNVIEMLNKKLTDILHVNKMKDSMFGGSLLEFDAEYREWLDELVNNDNITIDCK